MIERGAAQPGFLIPESLKAKVQTEGLPLFQRGRNNDAQEKGQVLTDEAAKRDIQFLERAISRYHEGKKDAEGAYEAALLPDAGLGIIAGAFGARVRVFRVSGNVQDFGRMNRLWNWLAVAWLVGGSVGVFLMWLFADELGMVRGHPDAYGLPEAPECYDARGQC